MIHFTRELHLGLQKVVPHRPREFEIPLSLPFFRFVLPVVLLGIGVWGGLAAKAQSCWATAADIQALRDNLETIRIQVQAARNESGYEKEPAADAVVTAIRALEETVGHSIAPSPESKVVRTPRGGAKHPHMQVIQQAFGAAQRTFDNARCALLPIEPLQKAMEDLNRALQFR